MYALRIQELNVLAFLEQCNSNPNHTIRKGYQKHKQSVDFAQKRGCGGVDSIEKES